MKNTTILAQYADITNGVLFVENILKEKKVPEKSLAKTLLLTEEALVSIIDSCDNSEEKIHISYSSFLGDATIHISCRGTEAVEISSIQKAFDFSEHLDLDSTDPEKASTIQSLLERVVGKNITINYKNHVNTIDIKAKTSKNRHLFYTLSAMFFGLIFGLLLKFLLPESISYFVADNIFDTISQIFLHLLGFVLAPLVFFSMASSVVGISDFKSLGRIAGKVFSCYIITSISALVIAYLTYQLMPVGDTSLAASILKDAKEVTTQPTVISIKDTILGIIPTDIITPFFKSDMLAIIFLAMIIGLSIATISKEHPGLKTAILSGDALFSKITTLIISIMPITVFCSIGKIAIKTDIKNLLKVFTLLPVMYIGYIFLLIFYLILLSVFGRLNPIKFLKGYYPAMLAAFAFSSSNAALPFSLKQCKEKLGISEKVYSFSIPLGATINMDGGCIVIMISLLFLAKTFGIPMPLSTIVPLAASILLLTLGAPGVSGATLVCIITLLPQIGVPTEASNLILGIYSLIAMGMCCLNVTGDSVVTSIVAKTENAIDMEKFNAN